MSDIEQRLREAMDGVEEGLRLAEVGEYLYNECAYSYGDGRTEPREYGIEWQWQQAKPDEYGQGELLAASTKWHAEQAADGIGTEATKLRDTIAALRKQVSDAVGEWRPIETAPKDGRTRILIIGHRGEHPDIAVWGNGRFLGKRKGYKQGWTTHPGYTVDPAHWMPLPPAELGAPAGPSGCAFDNDHLAWACERWQREVANRPLRNVHRRSLDDTWRQVIRRLGGDPAALLPMADHDTLVAENPDAAVRTPPAEPVVEALLSWVCEDVLPAYGVSGEIARNDPELAESCRATLAAKDGRS